MKSKTRVLFKWIIVSEVWLRREIVIKQTNQILESLDRIQNDEEKIGCSYDHYIEIQSWSGK
jgi:hypothetical protein